MTDEGTKPRVVVNGVGITQDQIDAEVQYHPANNVFEAQEEAVKALVIKELLLQRASKVGIVSETKDLPEAIIEKLLEKEISTSDPDEETCHRYYNNNKGKFVTTSLYEVSHILFLAPEDDDAARKKAQESALDILNQLKDTPDKFEDLAKLHSACSSSKEGGHLGQISKGETLPNFEKALEEMDEGAISAEPVETKVGFHVIQLHKKIEAKELPFEAVHEWIVEYLKDMRWKTEVRQYIQVLAGEAEIEGYKLPAAETPLVQ